MLKVFAVLLLTATSALAQQQMTAYAALKVVSRQVSPVALKRVISVSGSGGDPQPTRWNIVVLDRQSPQGVREIQVANGRVVSQGAPSASAGSTNATAIPTSKLNLDSSGAFTIANHTADTSHLNFSSVAYTLRANGAGQPVWIVTLQDQNRRSLGTIHINANRGNITRVEGLYRGLTPAPIDQSGGDRRVAGSNSAPQRDLNPADLDRGGASDDYVDAGEMTESSEGESDEDENVVKKELKRFFRHARNESERAFHRVRSSFQDFMDR